MSRFAFVAVLAAMLVSPAMAHDYSVGTLKINHPWSRATPKGASIGGGYLTITNNGVATDRLVGGSSAVSSRFEIHEMSMNGGVMKMRMLPKGLEIPPGQTVTFEPGGYHVMFKGLNQQLTKGQRFKATLQFQKAGEVNVDFVVDAIGAQHPGAAGGGHAKPDTRPGMSGGHPADSMPMKH